MLQMKKRSILAGSIISALLVGCGEALARHQMPLRVLLHLM